MNRIAIIGNGGGGKTTLARKLGVTLGLPLYHVDSIQFQPGWIITPLQDCDRILNGILEQDRWIIDGFGSRNAIERRLDRADTVVFVDYPLWVHYWWALKRQIANRNRPRSELPSGCPEFTISQTWQLCRALWRVHRQYTPWFRAKLASLSNLKQIFHIRSPKELSLFADRYCAVSVHCLESAAMTCLISRASSHTIFTKSDT